MNTKSCRHAALQDITLRIWCTTYSSIGNDRQSYSHLDIYAHVRVSGAARSSTRLIIHRSGTRGILTTRKGFKMSGKGEQPVRTVFLWSRASYWSFLEVILHCFTLSAGNQPPQMDKPSIQPQPGSYPTAQQQPPPYSQQPQQPVATFDQGARFDPNKPPTIPVSVGLVENVFLTTVNLQMTPYTHTCTHSLHLLVWHQLKLKLQLLKESLLSWLRRRRMCGEVALMEDTALSKNHPGRKTYERW